MLYQLSYASISYYCYFLAEEPNRAQPLESYLY